ncbi:MAG: FAD-binding oxidoreductase [Pseudomonadota bacterium]
MDEVVVVGGGITGAFAGYFLAKRSVRVTLIDDASPEHTATKNNPGGINPLHGPGIPGEMEPFAMHAYRLHAAHQQDIQQRSGVDPDYRVVARVELAFSQEDVHRIQALAPLYERNDGFSAQWLNQAHIRRTYPAVSADVLGGLQMKGNACVDTHAYRRAVVLAAQTYGMEQIQGHAEHVAPGLVRISGRNLHCKHVVLSVGPWLDRLVPELEAGLHITALKGQMLRATVKGAPPATDVTWGLHGLYQIVGNEYWLGGTKEDTGLDGEPDEQGKAEVLAGVRKMLPHLEALDVHEHVAGLRPCTSDGLPLLGVLPELENTVIADGSGSKGILYSAALGEQVARLVCEGQTDPRFEFLSPARLLS